MLILKIKERGHFITIPGLPPMRTPVNIKADNLDLKLAQMALRKANIKNFEIVSVEEVQEPKKEEVKYVEIPLKKIPSDNRIEKLENMMEMLLMRELQKPSQNQEQITKQLEDLENLLIERTGRKSFEVSKNSDPVIEEMDELYIPKVDVSGMKLKGKSTEKVVKSDEKHDENADLLADLLLNKGDS